MTKSSKFVVSHPTGNTFVRALLEQLKVQGLLERFFTTIGVGEDGNSLLNKCCRNRKYSIPDHHIVRHWVPEVFRHILNGTQSRKRFWADFSYSSLDREVASTLSKQSAGVLHAYEDGAAISFRSAKEAGIQCSYELPIAYWQTARLLLSEEAERYPEWEPTLESTREPEEKLMSKDDELLLADRITCPSRFVLDSIPSHIRKQKPCQISHFGSPRSISSIDSLLNKKNSPIKLLFVGSMSQRKGLADLFEGVKLINSKEIELSILGQPSLPLDFYRSKYKEFNYLSPRTNEEIRKVMKSHHALVLPSIVEGRALVQQEALSCGLPIITTKNAGGDDLVENGETGYIVPIRSPRDIAEKITLLCEQKNSFLEIQENCIKKAKEYSWADYAQKIIDFNTPKLSN